MTDIDRIDELTAFEVTQAERACGIAYETLGTKKDPGDLTPGRTALFGALAWVHQKRDEPTLTYDAFMKRIKPDEILAYIYPGDDEEEADAGQFPEGADVADGADVGPAGDVARVATGDEEGAVLSGDGNPAE